LKFSDLTGQRFGRLVAIKLIGRTKWGKGLWLCQCDCGKIAQAMASSLNMGQKKSCGCLKSKDLTGQRFGGLVAVELVGTVKCGSKLWLCRCDCGKTVRVTSRSLNARQKKSCGCLKIKDLTDQRFNKLVVIKRIGMTKRGSVLWLCQCDCGKTVQATSGSLNAGAKKSCGCLIIKDLTGQRFGRLVAIELAGTVKWGSKLWLCQCDCGKITQATSCSLRYKKSCGCLLKEAQHKLVEFNKLRHWQDIDENSDFTFTASQLRGMKLDAVYREDLKCENFQVKSGQAQWS